MDSASKGKIGFILSTLGLTRGGLETTATCLARLLAERGWRVTMVGGYWPGRKLAADLTELPVRWVRVACPPADLQLWSHVQRAGWAHTARAVIFSQQCRFRARVQQIIGSLDVTITFLPRETACVSLLRARRGRANVSYFPGGDVRWIERDHSVVKLVNPSVAARKAEELQEFHIDAVLPSGVPEIWLETGDSMRQSHPTLLFVGRLESNKGVADLVPIMAGIVPRYPSIELRIVGDGPLLEALRRQAASAGIERCITFTGAVPHERVLVEMRSADLLVFPTRHENLPLTLLEAQAAGLPFVASDIPGIQGYVHEQACLLPAGDIAAWIRTIDELIAGQETRRTMSSGGREWARARTWERVADEMGKHIELALSRAGGGFRR